jgi:hypothetical protein
MGEYCKSGQNLKVSIRSKPLELKQEGHSSTDYYIYRPNSNYLEVDMEKKDSPLYNIKKNYGYDINRNSGFNKK